MVETGGVVEIEVQVNQTTQIIGTERIEETILNHTYWPRFPLGNEGLSKRIYKSLKGTNLELDRYDAVNITQKFEFDMTLAPFDWEETRSFPK